MILTDQEPVALAVSFSTLLGAASALIVHYGWMDPDEIGLWAAFITILGGIAAALWARSKVASKHTVNEAGMTLDQVEAMAKDPNVKAV